MVTASSKQPDHEEHPGRHECERAFLSAQSQIADHRAPDDRDRDEGEPSQTRGELSVDQREKDEAESAATQARNPSEIQVCQSLRFRKV